MGTSFAAALKKQEEIIENAEYGFVAQGMALEEIRQKCLFQKAKGQEKVTFEEYCATRFEYTRRTADRLILGSRVAQLAEQFGLKITNEGQAREVTDLVNDPEGLEHVLTKAAESSPNGRLTAANIRQVRESLRARELEPGETPPSGSEVATVPDTDPADGEDWDAVLNLLRKSIRNEIRHFPRKFWIGQLAQMLEEESGKARKAAIKAARDGDNPS